MIGRSAQRHPQPARARLGQAQVFVFSGRPDPSWSVPPGLVARLEQVWEELEPFVGNGPAPPQLGYRGCRLGADDVREYLAFRGVVTRRTGGTTESRRDRGQRFEAHLLASAPEELLPQDMVIGTPDPD